MSNCSGQSGVVVGLNDGTLEGIDEGYSDELGNELGNNVGKDVDGKSDMDGIDEGFVVGRGT